MTMFCYVLSTALVLVSCLSSTQGESANRSLEQLFPSNCGRTSRTNLPRIVGGQPAPRHAWPWMALVGRRLHPGYPIWWSCAGSLITDRHVMTAAHCKQNYRYIVRLGEHNRKEQDSHHVKDINVSRFILHEDAGDNSIIADIAILVLERSVQFLDGIISPICLPFSSASQELLEEPGKEVWAAGWGTTEEGGTTSDILMEVQLNIVTLGKCKDAYEKQEAITQRQICTGTEQGGKDSCQGDSGGPVMAAASIGGVQRYYQLGIVSRGFGCGRRDYPGINMRVSYYLDWIAEKVRTTM